jgi:hypothetical protein
VVSCGSIGVLWIGSHHLVHLVHNLIIVEGAVSHADLEFREEDVRRKWTSRDCGGGCNGTKAQSPKRIGGRGKHLMPSLPLPDFLQQTYRPSFHNMACREVVCEADYLTYISPGRKNRVIRHSLDDGAFIGLLSLGHTLCAPARTEYQVGSAA